jgi:nucleotide sugar dehydrogenase
MICVPVLLSESGIPDLKAVREVAIHIGKGLKKGDVIALNPSVPPGTTEDLVLPIIERESGLLVENDFYMLYNPERIYEGRAIQDIEERYPAIISGAGERSMEVGKIIYPLIFKRGVLTVSNIRTAETEKLLEGVYRDVNIALANELAEYCEKIGVNFWECKEAANSQPYCHLHSPGVGVGGACIPVYPQFILHSSTQVSVDCEMIKMGRSINLAMPARCVREAIKLFEGKINNEFVSAKAIVTLLGIAFRGGVSDTRLSPTYEVIKEFQKFGVREIRIHDPLVKFDSKLSDFQNVTLTCNLEKALKDTDLVMLIADHSEYNNLKPMQIDGAPIYDGRGILNRTFFDNSHYAVIGIGNKSN